MALENRDPWSVEGAIAEQLSVIGAKQAAHIVGLSLSMVYRAASDTEKGTLDDLSRLKLDAACLSQHGTTPYLDWQRRLVEQMAAAKDYEPRPAEIVALDVDAAVGNISNAILEAKCPNGPGGERWTKQERTNALRKIAKAHRKLDELAVTVNLESGGNVVTLRHEGPVK